MTDLTALSSAIRALAERWAEMAAATGVKDQIQAENAMSYALLATSISVLTADGPLNAYENLLLAQLFGSTEIVERFEAKGTAGGDLLGDGLQLLLVAVKDFAAQPDYRPDADPVLSVLGDIFDVGLAADKFPSESEAWAASRVLGKLRRAVLEVSPSFTMELPKRDHQPPPAVTKADAAPRVVLAAADQTERVRALLLELNNLVGLESVKEEVETLVNLARVRAMRTARGLPSPAMSYHLVFSGTPGTGKTTVARILGQIYGALGMLTVGSCIEVDRSALIGGYLGQTTTKTAAVLDKALGSVLFVDEAYSLTEGEADQYGEEAVSVILKFMEDHRDNFVLIAAGYTEQMDAFLGSNPGLRSRFARTINFPDYGLDELMEILRRMSAADGYRLDDGVIPVARFALGKLLEARAKGFANAREVRRLYERAIGKQANRIAGTEPADDELCLLLGRDF